MARTVDSHDNPTGPRDAVATTTRWQKAIGILGLSVVLWVGTNLFDVVSSGESGPPGGHGPGENPPGQTTDDQGRTPPSGESPHDPSQFNH